MGRDDDGFFEGIRRYSDFFNVRNALIHRWPGVFIPAIPPKKAVGNKEEKFIEERMVFLDKFIKKCGKYPFILNCQEFKLFSRL